MSLLQAYLVLASILLSFGGLIYGNAACLKTFRRSNPATVILLLLAVSWFGWQLNNLPEPDLAGLPREPVLIVFIGAALLSYFTMPDFLSVRSLAVIMLFVARLTLDAGYRKLPYSLLDASVSYGFLVFFGFWWAASPVAFNAQCDWVLEKPLRHKITGLIFIFLGLACLLQIKFLP